MGVETSVRVWDLPLRIYHWLMILLFVFAWWSAENGALEWHFRAGTAVLGLLLFRLIWGFIGGSTARFGSFVRAPGAILAYMRRPPGSPPLPGHSPPGGYGLLAILILLFVQVASGLLSADGGSGGPGTHLVSERQGRIAAGVHDASFDLLLIVIALHLVAITYKWVQKRRNLVTPMVTGRDPQLTGGTGGLVPASGLRFLVSAGAAGILAILITNGFSS